MVEVTFDCGCMVEMFGVVVAILGKEKLLFSAKDVDPCPKHRKDVIADAINMVKEQSDKNLKLLQEALDKPSDEIK